MSFTYFSIFLLIDFLKFEFRGLKRLLYFQINENKMAAKFFFDDFSTMMYNLCFLHDLEAKK